MLLYISLGINILFIAAVVFVFYKPDAVSRQMGRNFEIKISELEKRYQEEEAALANHFKQRNMELVQELTDYRNKLNHEIEEEFMERRQHKINQLNQEFEYRVDSIKEREEIFEKSLNERLEESRIMFEIEQDEIRRKLESLRSYEAAAIDARVRMYEENNEDTFYKINLTEQDILEINELEQILPHLRNGLPLRRAIFDIYYRGPVKDMINRILGQESRITGIYKITLIETGECYVGQSVDIKSRWMQHTRRGFGVDEGTQNKLYPAMKKYGLHSFKFELIETSEEDFLSEKEKYWAEYFGAQTFGFSLKN